MYLNSYCRINEHGLGHNTHLFGTYLAETKCLICMCSQMNAGHS
jgi:hypothetical protein